MADQGQLMSFEAYLDEALAGSCSAHSVACIRELRAPTSRLPILPGRRTARNRPTPRW